MEVIVLSDLHATTAPSAAGEAASYIDYTRSHRDAKHDPLVGFQHLLETGTLMAPELLLCTGDIGDKADPIAIRNVWDELTKTQSKHSIKSLIATCGNHDLDSRHKDNKFDPKGHLRNLSPPYPFPNLGRDAIAQLRYWADNYSIIENDRWRVLNINSCAYHGYGQDITPELNHGRISDYTLENIEGSLSQAIDQNDKKINLCLLHHHLRGLSTDDFDDTSAMKGARRLLELLSQASMGNWMVIHGHRHRADLYLAGGGNAAPLVLSCGSFSATRNGDKDNPSPNQFYVLKFANDQTTTAASLKGRIEAWNWTPSIGWQNKLSIPGGIPTETGFGFRGDLRTIASQLQQTAQQQFKLDRNTIHQLFPDIQFMIPQDIDNFIHLLEAEKNITVTRDNFSISEIVWSVR